MTDKELHDKKLTSIDVLIKALGTMVMIPKYEKDVNDIGGVAKFAGTIQQPILLDKDRSDGLEKLNELIKSL